MMFMFTVMPWHCHGRTHTQSVIKDQIYVKKINIGPKQRPHTRTATLKRRRKQRRNKQPVSKKNGMLSIAGVCLLADGTKLRIVSLVWDTPSLHLHFWTSNLTRHCYSFLLWSYGLPSSCNLKANKSRGLYQIGRHWKCVCTRVTRKRNSLPLPSAEGSQLQQMHQIPQRNA